MSSLSCIRTAGFALAAPGGAAALQCLQRNVAKLSPGCQSAVKAISPPEPAAAAHPVAPAPAPAAAAPEAMPAPVAAPAAPPAAAPAAALHKPTVEQQAALRQLCGADYMAKCGHVAPATAEAMQCLQSHASELSENCRGAACASTRGRRSRPRAAAPARSPAPARAAVTPPKAPPPAPAAAARPTAQQQAAIRQFCQSDFMANCSGVQPVGAAALQCLQRNGSRLSPNCRSAVASLSGGAAPAAASAAASATPAIPPTTQQIEAIKFTCRRDVMMHCRSVARAGGPEVMACLQRNLPRLTPDCRTSLAAVVEAAPATAAAATPRMPAPAAVPPGPFPLRRANRQRMMGQ